MVGGIILPSDGGGPRPREGAGRQMVLDGWVILAQPQEAVPTHQALHLEETVSQNKNYIFLPNAIRLTD